MPYSRLQSQPSALPHASVAEAACLAMAGEVHEFPPACAGIEGIPGIPRGVSCRTDGASGAGSWRWTAQWTSNGKRIDRHFPILALGWETAFWMAVVARREVTPDLEMPRRCPPIPEHIARWIESSTPSTMGGVRLVSAQSGGIIHAWSWYASHGAGRVAFSILKYGYEEAHRLACASRRAGVPCDLPDPPVPPMTDEVREWIAMRKSQIAASRRAKATARQPASRIDVGPGLATHEPDALQHRQQDDAPAPEQQATTIPRLDRTQVPHLQTLPGFRCSESAALAFDADTLRAGDLDDLAVEGPEAAAMFDAARAAVRAAIDAAPLGRLSRKIIALRFGFDCCDNTLDGIGQMFDLTGERIRQLETKALEVLKDVFVERGLGPEVFDALST